MSKIKDDLGEPLWLEKRPHVDTGESWAVHQMDQIVVLSPFSFPGSQTGEDVHRCSKTDEYIKIRRAWDGSVVSELEEEFKSTHVIWCKGSDFADVWLVCPLFLCFDGILHPHERGFQAGLLVIVFTYCGWTLKQPANSTVVGLAIGPNHPATDNYQPRTCKIDINWPATQVLNWFGTVGMRLYNNQKPTVKPIGRPLTGIRQAIIINHCNHRQKP